MGRLSFLTRVQRTGLLWNVTDHVVQIARLGELEKRPLAIDRCAEFAAGDDEGVTGWVRETFPDRGVGYLAGYCGFHPTERVLLREAVNTRRLAEPEFLPGLFAEHAK